MMGGWAQGVPFTCTTADPRYTAKANQVRYERPRAQLITGVPTLTVFRSPSRIKRTRFLMPTSFPETSCSSQLHSPPWATTLASSTTPGTTRLLTFHTRHTRPVSGGQGMILPRGCISTLGGLLWAHHPHTERLSIETGELTVYEHGERGWLQT